MHSAKVCAPLVLFCTVVAASPESLQVDSISGQGSNLVSFLQESLISPGFVGDETSFLQEKLQLHKAGDVRGSHNPNVEEKKEQYEHHEKVDTLRLLLENLAKESDAEVDYNCTQNLAGEYFKEVPGDMNSAEQVHDDSVAMTQQYASTEVKEDSMGLSERVRKLKSGRPQGDMLNAKRTEAERDLRRRQRPDSDSLPMFLATLACFAFLCVSFRQASQPREHQVDDVRLARRHLL